MELSDSISSSEEQLESQDESLYMPTPERLYERDSKKVSVPKMLALVDLSKLDEFVKCINQIRGCKTPGCKGTLVPIQVHSIGLGGALSISFGCNGCRSNGVVLNTSGAMSKSPIANEISMSVQLAFIIAGCTHATYYKTLRHALGIHAVSASGFMATIKCMYPVVKAMLDALCEKAKSEMKAMEDEKLGSWKRAVTCADGTWQTRGWHSKNATFSIRNYLNGALLYYMHLCQKGRDDVIEEELYLGTSKSAEGFSARKTFKKAKEEGMQIVIHWQDADSSSSNAVAEVFPEAEIMVCGGHAGRAHKKQLEKRAKEKSFSKSMNDKYKKVFPEVNTVQCHCSRHKPGCGCLSNAFIARAHTNFSSILTACTSKEEFVRKLKALPQHARNRHEWNGGKCDFHPLRVCTCNSCGDNDTIRCDGKPYKTRMELTCPFHSLAYEIECHERAGHADKLVHPILKRGHSNAVEASHNIMMRFRSKEIHLERLHYEVCTNLGLLQANLSYMHKTDGTDYHWIPELYRRMQLPVFHGVEEALKKYNEHRQKYLGRLKSDECKMQRVRWKVERTKDAQRRKEWSKKHGHDTYGHDDDIETGTSKGKSHNERKCKACGSSTHMRSTHKDCPFNKRQGTSTKDHIVVLSEEEFDCNSEESGTDVPLDSEFSDDDVITIVSDSQCTCGVDGRAHKQHCPMNYRNRCPGRSLFPQTTSSREARSSQGDNLGAPPIKKARLGHRYKVGDGVYIHCGEHHIACRIVRIIGKCYQLYCSEGVIKTLFSYGELMPFTGCSIPLDKWRQAPRISLRRVKVNSECFEHCNCPLSERSESIAVLSSSEDANSGSELWVTNRLYSLTYQCERTITPSSGWLTDEVISAAQLLILQYTPPSISGLEPPVLKETYSFAVHTGDFVQIINIKNQHWCVVSTVGCDNGVVNMYDSLCSSLSQETMYLIASLISNTSSKLEIRMMDVERQSNGSDCGVLAIAYAFDICTGFNPCTVKFDPTTIRQHLVKCLEKCKFSRFPIIGERKCVPMKSSVAVDLHCTCHMPEQKGDEMAECESCHVWYHRHCLDIPDEVFGDSDVEWQCKACLASPI